MLILTILNILLFLLSLGLLFMAGKKRTSAANRTSDRKEKERAEADRIRETYRNIAASIEEVKSLHTEAIGRIEEATENAIRQFSGLVLRLENTKQESTEILKMIKRKLSLGIIRDTVDGKYDHHLTREKCEALLEEVTGQFSLIREQRAEDLKHLKRIRETMDSLIAEWEALSSRAGTGNPSPPPEDIGKRLESVREDMGNAARDMEEAAEIESRFTLSTVFLLEDIVLSMTDAFVRLNGIMESTLGESSSFGEEIERIIVNLQFQDVSQEMSQYIIKHLASVVSELHGLQIAGLREADFQEIDREIGKSEAAFEGSEKEEEVIFF